MLCDLVPFKTAEMKARLRNPRHEMTVFGLHVIAGLQIVPAFVFAFNTPA
jgi:hypothetical protein